MAHLFNSGRRCDPSLGSQARLGRAHTGDLQKECCTNKDGPNLRRYAEQIIKRAGGEQWPKLFVNCRASCEKDLMDGHRPDAVLAWIGHSARVALQHYAPGPTESDYKKAVQNPVQLPAVLVPQEPSILHGSREKRLHSLEDAQTQYPRQGSNL